MVFQGFWGAMCICIYVYMCICIYVYIYVPICIYVYMYVYVGPKSNPHLHKIELNASPEPTSFPWPFLNKFSSHLGSNLRLSCRPRWGHVGQEIDFWRARTHAKTTMMSNRCPTLFGTVLEPIQPKIIPKLVKHRSKIDQNRPKSNKNRSQIGSGTDFASESLFRCDFGPMLVPAWDHFGCQVGSMLA